MWALAVQPCICACVRREGAIPALRGVTATLAGFAPRFPTGLVAWTQVQLASLRRGGQVHKNDHVPLRDERYLIVTASHWQLGTCCTLSCLRQHPAPPLAPLPAAAFCLTGLFNLCLLCFPPLLFILHLDGLGKELTRCRFFLHIRHRRRAKQERPGQKQATTSRVWSSPHSRLPPRSPQKPSWASHSTFRSTIVPATHARIPGLIVFRL